jgi:hypothetical protein
MREEKTCPDCAEHVLAQARLCRFCGHRFASAKPASPFALLRRPPPDTRALPEMLLDWDIDLLEDEEVAFFGFCSLESDDGFLLVTNRRLVFFVPRGSRKLLEWPTETLVEVEVGGRRSRAWLRLESATGRVTLSHFASEAVLGQVADLLRAARPQ